MPALSEYSNVYNSAILILQEKGFRCWVDDATQTYRCEKGGWDFMAESPVGLLGLVAIFEHIAPIQYREYWWRKEGDPVFETLTHDPPDFLAVYPSKTESS
jgi:hypothetical protein